MNLVRLLEESARKFTWRTSLVSEKGKVSFYTLNKKATRLANGLSEKLRLKAGDKVALLLPNCPEFIVSVFAVLKVQAICVPLNVFLTPPEIKYILEDSQAKILISSSEFLEMLRALLQEKRAPASELTGLEHIVLIDQKKEEFLYSAEIELTEKKINFTPAINPQDVAMLIYTSGTTGFPKGVMLSHANICSNVIASMQALEFSRHDRVLLILPMFHSFTLMVCIFIPIYVGARIIVVKSLKPFQRVLRSILLNRVTVIVGIPHLYDIFKNLILPKWLFLFLRVRVCISGAAPLSAQTFTAFREKFKKNVLLEGYGLSEASPVVSVNPLRGEQKPGSIGLPLPGIEVKIIADDESEVSPGQIGELIVKGPNVMQGYLHNPEETKQVLRGGWLFTGDMAKIDDEGYIYIVGRKKEMILVHGMNVYPSEIENVLGVHQQIKEVAVVGKRDSVRGEAPVAYIVLKEGARLSENEIINFCKGKLAPYKIPHTVEFRKELPKTPTGKVLKRKLKEEQNA